MTMLSAFRERLALAMDADPRSRAAICRKAGYAHSHIRRLISGERHSPTLPLVATMAEALEVSPAWLLGLSEEIKP